MVLWASARSYEMPRLDLPGGEMKNGDTSMGLSNLNNGSYIQRQANGDQRPLEAGDGIFTIGLDPPLPDGSPPLDLDDDNAHYDPHMHRQTDAPTTNVDTLVHLLKGSLGTGILAMPNAFYHAGMVVGFVGTVLIGSLCTYCMHVLIRSQYELCRQLRVPLLSYPRTVEVALDQGPSVLRKATRYAGTVVNGFLVTYQLGICCVYVVFVASNLKEVADIYWMPVNVRLYMLMLLAPLILLNYVRNLKLLSPFSTLANVITFVGLGITMYYVFRDIPSPSERDMVGQLRNFPLFVGTTLFALEGVGVIIAIESNMKTPRSFIGYTGVLNRGMAIIVTLYVFVGFCGYVRYGSESKGSITLNLPLEDILAQSVKVMFAIAIFITYALQCYLPVEIIWNSCAKERFAKSSNKKQLFFEYLIRTLLVIATFLLAVAIPRLELFISLFGALCLSALGIIFPSIIEICLLWPDRNFGRYNWILAKDILLFFCGLVALVIGTYTSLQDIITSLI
ncbi:proton-coupled amino acid transporter-like protein CG1139 isoform X1 [Anabrus simplex]|uniref:proton-coupled amino acid transporter-like protein CG1139 isoform X1 n=1 Tax=Anabrus simplex TaxID=316456 RepID=UPI0035A304B1